MKGFARLLQSIVREYKGRKQDFAREVGLTPVALSRYLNGHNLTKPRLEVLLKIAHVGGVSPTIVFAAAGCGAHDKLTQHLYGPAAARQFSADENHIINVYRSLAPRQRWAFMFMIDRTYTLGAESPRARQSGARA